MTEERDKIVVGLTGSFGSGCSTLMKSLVKLNFKEFRLSEYVRDEFHKKTGKPKEEATKKELQDIGDQMRQENGMEYLAYLASEGAKKFRNEPLVFDSIRNIGEANFFRKKYHDFFLIAVDCGPKKRWERIKDQYLDKGLDENQFEIDEKRDKYDEKTKFGQSVDFCVDDADVLIDNEKDYPDEDIAVDNLKDKISPYIGLMKGDLSRTPTFLETNMGIAYTASLQSRCVKRRVGAVIVDEKYNSILSVGYNENPHPIEPCIIKYKRCYRDHYKSQYFKHLEKIKQRCPQCGELLKNLKPPFRCTCGFDLDRNMQSDKIMGSCTALHAEEKAILNIGSRNIGGCTLYTTTFPCFTCAQKIVYSKLGSVVFVEPYPDQDSVNILAEAGISIRKFEGITAKAYFRVFGSWQKDIEESLYKK
jgi:deoxycytidylate deaminase